MAKIPEHAKCVFKGILFDVYQWEQELFDKTHTTFEAIKRIPTVQIIATTPQNKIILLKEEQPHCGKFIAVPGGMVERDDTVEKTVEKELLEEIGSKAQNITLWKTTTLGSKIEWKAHYYIAKNCKKIQEPTPEPGEKIEPYELSFEEFLEETQKDEFRNKALADMIFRIIHTKGELDKFKKLLFDE